MPSWGERYDHKEALVASITCFNNDCHDPDDGRFCGGPGNPGTPRTQIYDEFGRSVTKKGELHKNRASRPPIVLGNIAYVPLSNDEDSLKALIDKDDVDLVGKYTWVLDKSIGYPVTRIRGTLIPLHDFLGKDKEGKEWDHANRDKLDNRRANLRLATSSQNKMNKSIQSNNTSGLKGVSLRKDTGKWGARIKVEGKYKSLGSFDTREEAGAAYDKAAKKYFGEFANPNE